MTRLAIILAVIATPAAAEWKVDSFKDRMTDKINKTATVAAAAPDSGISANLRVSCMNGSPMMFADISGALTPGRVSGAYRLDSGSVQPALLSVTSDPHQVAFIAPEPGILSGRKQMRLQLSPYGKTLIFQFDVSGSEKIIPLIRC